jgi:hypothetical protein
MHFKLELLERGVEPLVAQFYSKQELVNYSMSVQKFVWVWAERKCEIWFGAESLHLKNQRKVTHPSQSTL